MDKETLITRSNDFVKQLSYSSCISFKHGNIGEAKAFYNEAMGAYSFMSNMVVGHYEPTQTKLMGPGDYLKELFGNDKEGYSEYSKQVSSVRWQENTGE
jgi:hypothetical protein